MFLLIKNAHIYAPEDLGINDVLVCNEKIIAVQPHIEFSWTIDQDFKVIDASGKFLVPGFIDQHVHIIGGGGEDGFASLIPEIQMTDCIKYGVTTVVGLLGTDSNAKSVKALVAKTKALREQGMSAWCLTGAYQYPSPTLTGSVASDIAFIDEIIGVKIAFTDHRSSNISAEQIAYLATQARDAALLAHKAGEVHMHSGRGKHGYADLLKVVEETDIPVSQFRPTHVGNQLEDAVKFADMGGYIDFTSGLETSVTAKMIAETMKKVPLAQITLSSDSNGSFPNWSEDKKLIGMGIGKMVTLYDTVRKLIIEQNVPMTDALSLITCNPADALLFKSKGHIAKDMDADFVMLNEELNITDVIARGRVMMENTIVTARNYYDFAAD